MAWGLRVLGELATVCPYVDSDNPKCHLFLNQVKRKPLQPPGTQAGVPAGRDWAADALTGPGAVPLKDVGDFAQSPGAGAGWGRGASG